MWVVEVMMVIAQELAGLQDGVMMVIAQERAGLQDDVQTLVPSPPCSLSHVKCGPPLAGLTSHFQTLQENDQTRLYWQLDTHWSRELDLTRTETSTPQLIWSCHPTRVTEALCSKERLGYHTQPHIHT